jgi:hypothetical protein
MLDDRIFCIAHDGVYVVQVHSGMLVVGSKDVIYLLYKPLWGLFPLYITRNPKGYHINPISHGI